MTNYPVSLPIDAVTLLIEIVKARQVGARKVEAAKAAWNIQGYAQKMLIGDVLASSEGETLNEVLAGLNTLQDELVSYESEGMSFSAGDEEEAGNVMVILSIIGVVIQVINLLRNRKDNNDA